MKIKSSKTKKDLEENVSNEISKSSLNPPTIPTQNLPPMTSSANAYNTGYVVSVPNSYTNIPGAYAQQYPSGSGTIPSMPQESYKLIEITLIDGNSFLYELETPMTFREVNNELSYGKTWFAIKTPEGMVTIRESLIAQIYLQEKV